VFLDGLQQILRARGQADAVPGVDFDPPWTTVGIGKIAGGTAANIVPRECRLTWEFRSLPGVDGAEIHAMGVAKAAELDAAIKREAPEGSVTVERYANIPPFKPELDGPATKLAMEITGANAPITVSFGTEAGQFQKAGFPAVICGPGSVEQAHQPNEFVAVSEIEKGLAVFARFIETLRR
jgi:acetylornithine deacetylase